MRKLLIPLLLLPVLAARAQQDPTAPPPSTDPNPYTLSAKSNLVLVPTQVQTKHGEILYDLKPEQFTLEDNGVPQRFNVEQDSDALGISLVVVVQCSRSAFQQFNNMRGLAAMVDSLVGGAPRQVAVVQYGGEPELLGRFTSNPDHLTTNLAKIQPCDDAGNATLDAVDYANKLFDETPKATARTQNRRAILLIGETRDHGSQLKASQVIADLGRSNTVVDSVSFNPGKTDIVNSLIHGQYGPGPFGLLIMAVEALRKNVPHTLSTLTGGEYTNFTTEKGFDEGIHRLSNHIHNYYLLSFQPPATSPAGLHRLTVKVPDYPDAQLHFRLTYYSGTQPPPDLVEDRKLLKDNQ